MPSRKKKQQAQKAANETVSAKCYSAMEVDPAKEDLSLLEALREKNKDALRHVLDPSCGPFKSSKPNTDETVWYLTSSSHHMTGNLDLLTDVTPVYDRWIRSILGIGPPAQVLAHGSVNSNGIILHDVWFVPDINVNVVSLPQLGLEWHMDADHCLLRRSDDQAVVGTGHLGTDGLYELDFINLSRGPVWYIASNVSQHMTGDLHLLTDFIPIRPSHTVKTHTGARLQVCGKGSVKTGPFMIPDVCYVPGLG
uniref:Retrovirus-related Pol polyprotein from transposon TNT 1-94-like beta-barrel domain-containing protein n=1 Tax=Setaria viridis TaxID=4556 RepID=A0A4U6VF58_SETVI|nr:uncharacterized protein LOC117846933 [Setaria viridis]TKW28028.1 hypothetical protein SEVIR_3G296700v2 [Setaria viridis]